MMGQQKGERELFSYAINLEKRVRSDHPLRRVAAAIDFKFVREEVAHCYGSKGNVSVGARGNERQKIFRDERDQAQFADLLERSRARYDVAVLAFVLLGNHFHLIAQTHRPNVGRWMQMRPHLFHRPTQETISVSARTPIRAV